MLLYNSILKINPNYYLPCWILYMDLIETKNNPEDYDFYDWNSINITINNCYKINLKENVDIIIEIVKNCVIDITNKTKNYSIEDNEVILDLGLINCSKCHHIIDAYGNCSC
jgi:hypothetical protein